MRNQRSGTRSTTSCKRAQLSANGSCRFNITHARTTKQFATNIFKGEAMIGEREYAPFSQQVERNGLVFALGLVVGLLIGVLMCLTDVHGAY